MCLLPHKMTTRIQVIKRMEMMEIMVMNRMTMMVQTNK